MPTNASGWSKVLFVAPDDRSLKVIPELDALYELGYSVVTLQGQVDDDRLFDAVRTRRYDILHLAAHGDRAGLALTKLPLSFQGIQQVARQCGARLVLLNECNSASIAQRLVNGGLPVGIGTFDDVDDAQAKQMSMAFYQELSRSGDPHAAYTFACTGEHYGYFSNGSYAQLIAQPVTALAQQVRFVVLAAATSVGLSIVNAIGLLLHSLRLWGG